MLVGFQRGRRRGGEEYLGDFAASASEEWETERVHTFMWGGLYDLSCFRQQRTGGGGAGTCGVSVRDGRGGRGRGHLSVRGFQSKKEERG